MAAALAAIGAVAQGVKTFASESGQMKMTYTSWAAKMLDDGRIQFVAKGRPVRAFWGQQKATVECLELAGTATMKGKRDLKIETAQMKGGFTLVNTLASSNRQSNAPQTVVLKSETADYTASTSTVKMAGSVTVANDDPGANRKMSVKGSSATVGLSPNLSQPDRAIRSAVLEGPVSFTVHGVRDVRDAKTGKSAPVPVVIAGRANRLNYDGNERKLSLFGNVRIASDDPMLSGTVEGLTDATIVFNPRFDPVSVEMNGDPGTSTLKPKPGGKN